MPRKKEKRDERRGRDDSYGEQRFVAKKRECVLCLPAQTGKDRTIILSYKDPSLLSRFVSDRGKIISRSRTGMCSKHQRNVTREIKRARHLALLPFVVGPQ